MSVNHLVQRILSLQEACFMAFDMIDADVWQQPSDAFNPGSEFHDLLERMLKISRETEQSAIEFKARGFRIKALSIPRHIIEATEPHDALFNLEPPAGRADDDPLTGFCRGLQLVILRSVYNKQRDALAADLIARTAGRDDAMPDTEDSDESAPTD
ncbi:hypothetical protein EWM64_g9424 [Hericium alpestre]|uniref:Uncharacterized protein n=1 Tax=Hericium alpestre TaxID=135208 RepID=A0A4Y9ZMD2_9AGAM|nr:hypothetical protein EWM64_g9424 [Hericium alpestre]